MRCDHPICAKDGLVFVTQTSEHDDLPDTVYFCIECHQNYEADPGVKYYRKLIQALQAARLSNEHREFLEGQKAVVAQRLADAFALDLRDFVFTPEQLEEAARKCR